MFKCLMRLISLALVFLSVLQIAAFADTLEGRVSQANSTGLNMIVYDAQGRPYPNALRLKVDKGTQVKGVPSVSDLRPNDAVGAQVHQEETGVWHADRITLFQEVNAHPATKAPSSSLRDVLGNPVARGALLGAATGAIAASASHGKAGKGALVGAGVGAAAGLLEGMFSQHSKNSSDADSQQRPS